MNGGCRARVGVACAVDRILPHSFRTGGLVKIELTALEARVIGCLIEKQITTPDQYPLSLNALTNACNQKSNRDPVMALDESTVQQTIDALNHKHLILERSGFGSRVPKYQHRFCNAEFGSLQLSGAEVAILCELMLRGPQTPGELRSRAGRMTALSGVEEVESALEGLASRADGPLVLKLPREPGRRESRYAQLFTGAPPAMPVIEERVPVAAVSPPGEARLAQLEEQVAELRAEIERLKQRLG
jgi:uncharacterized protein YceH (UPF0502 family)